MMSRYCQLLESCNLNDSLSPTFLLAEMLQLSDVRLHRRVAVRHCVGAEDFIVVALKRVTEAQLHVPARAFRIQFIELFFVWGGLVRHLAIFLVPAELVFRVSMFRPEGR